MKKCPYCGLANPDEALICSTCHTDLTPPPLKPARAPAFPVPDQYRADLKHLNLLSIFHYIGAGLAVLGLGFLLLHFTIFHTVMSDPAMWQNQKQGPPPQVFFDMLNIFYFVGGIWFVSSAVLNLISAMYLRVHKHRTFSFVVACVNCLHMPLGTILGVFTIVALCRDSVQELYSLSDQPAPTGGGG
jgi:hypothetical protein